MSDKIRVLLGEEQVNEKKIVGTMSCLTVFAVHERVGKTAYVSRSYPYIRVHEDSTVKTCVESVFLNEFFPPSTLDIVFEFYAERAVVPSVSQTAVNFASGEDKTTTLAKSNEFVHSQISHHNSLSAYAQ